MGSSNERIESKITADVSRDEEPQKNFKCSNWVFFRFKILHIKTGTVLDTE